MEPRTIECLACGAPRLVPLEARVSDAGECPRCGYVGWAPSTDLTETLRRLIRERPLERRRLYAA